MTQFEHIYKIESNKLLTEQELHVLAVLATAWEEYIQLPDLHPSHKKDFEVAVHQAQRLIMSRPVSRELGPKSECISKIMFDGDRYVEVRRKREDGSQWEVAS